MIKSDRQSDLLTESLLQPGLLLIQEFAREFWISPEEACMLNLPTCPALIRFRSAVFGLTVLLMPGASAPAEVRESVTIKSCYDGDTCRTMTGEKIRLACIDTPELRGKRAQPERAKAARDRLRGMVAGKTVNLRRITTDRYGRTVGELYVDGMNVQQAMVASRHAEIYWKYAHQCPWSK